MKAKRFLGLAVAVAVVAAAVVVLLVRPSGAQGAALKARQRAMELLGARVAGLLPGCHVLVLSNPFVPQAGYLSEKSQFERAGISGLRKGLGAGPTVEIVAPEVRPNIWPTPQSVLIPPDCRTPLSFVVRAESVAQLAEAHPGCRVIVSLIGLPAGVEQLALWDKGDPRCFALLLPDLRLLGPPAAAEEAFERGKILAAVVEDLQSGEPLVVTRENVAEVLQRQPKSLGY